VNNSPVDETRSKHGRGFSSTSEADTNRVYRVRTKLAGAVPGFPIVTGPVHWNVVVPDNWSPATVPVSASAQFGSSLRINDAETVLSATLPVIEPGPETPSHVKLPDNDEPLWVMIIVILQPVENDSHPVRFHVPETSTGGLGDVGVDEHADSTNEITTAIQAHRMGLISTVLQSLRRTNRFTWGSTSTRKLRHGSGKFMSHMTGARGRVRSADSNAAPGRIGALAATDARLASSIRGTTCPHVPASTVPAVVRPPQAQRLSSVGLAARRLHGPG